MTRSPGSRSKSPNVPTCSIYTFSNPVSSANTRLAAASTLSSSCTNPPIKDHFPIAGSKFRFSRSSFNSPSSKPKMIQSTDT
jgi:hypothetical protein